MIYLICPRCGLFADLDMIYLIRPSCGLFADLDHDLSDLSEVWIVRQVVHPFFFCLKLLLDGMHVELLG